jgi:hypothetical protein
MFAQFAYQRGPMRHRPLLDEAPGCAGLDFTCQRSAGEVEGPVLALVLRIRVGRCVLSVVHSDHDAEEGRDDGPAVVYVRRFPLGSA